MLKLTYSKLTVTCETEESQPKLSEKYLFDKTTAGQGSDFPSGPSENSTLL